jgi:uncharacterized protein (TIGR03435 family)
VRVLLLLALSIGAVSAQTFEVVSIKPVDKSVRPGPPRSDPGMVAFPNSNLKALISRAYEIAPYQINGPAWMDTAPPYSFSARIPEGVSEDKVPVMMQAMLADRFGLKAHWESPVQPVFELVVGKDGPKLKRTDLVAAVKGPDGKAVGMLDMNAAGHIAFRATSMGSLARWLSNQAGRPVIDKTGIDGIFDIDMDSDPSELAALRRMSAAGELALPDNSGSSSIFTAIQSLGLKLESKKEPVQHLVIDSVRKEPTEN